jgi:hypothetical protein
MQQVFGFLLGLLLLPLAILLRGLTFIIRILEGKLFSNGSIDKKVTYELVKADLPHLSHLIDTHRCSKCGVESQDLFWYHFRSSDASWRHLAGCEGFYSKCPKCASVNSIVTAMN